MKKILSKMIQAMVLLGALSVPGYYFGDLLFAQDRPLPSEQSATLQAVADTADTVRIDAQGYAGDSSQAVKARADTVAGDSAQAAEARAKAHADTTAGDSAQAAEARAKAHADTTAGDSSQAALATARGEMPDTSLAVFAREIVKYIRIAGDDSTVLDSLLHLLNGLRVTGIAWLDSLILNGRGLPSDTGNTNQVMGWNWQWKADNTDTSGTSGLIDDLQTELDSTQLEIDSLTEASAAQDSTIKAKAQADSTFLDSMARAAATISPVTIERLGTPFEEYFLDSLAARNINVIYSDGDSANWADGAGRIFYQDSIYRDGDMAVGVRLPPVNNAGVNYPYAHNMAAENDTTFFIEWAWYWPQSSLDNMTGGLYIAFNNDSYPTVSSMRYIYVAKAGWSQGWNYLSAQMKNYSSSGSGTWSGVQSLSIINGGGAPLDSIDFFIEYIRITSKDPAATRPNPFQNQQDSTIYYTTTSSSKVTIKEEFGKPRLGSDADQDSLVSGFNPFLPFTGQTIVSQVDSSYLCGVASGAISLAVKGGNKVHLRIPGGTGDSTDFPYSADDTLDYTIAYLSGEVTANISRHGNPDTVLTGASTATGTKQVIKLYGLDRIDEITATQPGNLFKMMTAADTFFVVADSIKPQ